jgi:hypothetical protein
MTKTLTNSRSAGGDGPLLHVTAGSEAGGEGTGPQGGVVGVAEAPSRGAEPVGTSFCEPVCVHPRVLLSTGHFNLTNDKKNQTIMLSYSYILENLILLNAKGEDWRRRMLLDAKSSF